MTIDALKSTARETCASLRDWKRRLSGRIPRIPTSIPPTLSRKNVVSCVFEPEPIAPPPRVDRTSIAATATPQLDSGLFSRLPYDVRLMIYEQVWADAGTDQHIVQVRIGSAPTRPRPSRHASANRELTHFACICHSTDEDNDDDYGMRKRKYGTASLNEAYWGAKNQFMRPWCPHWQCDSVPVGSVDHYLSTSALHSTAVGILGGRPFGFEIEKPKKHPSSPFLGILLSCKAAYLEGIVSLYQSIRFCFMDYFHLESFLRVVPLEHLRHIRSIHLCECVSANLFMCHDRTAPRWTAVWSYIPLLEQLQELHIWLYPSWVGRELPEDDLLRIMYHIRVPNFIVEIPRDERPDEYLPEYKNAPFQVIRPVVEFSQRDPFQPLM